MLATSGIPPPPPPPIPIFLMISAIPPRPATGLRPGAEVALGDRELDSLGDDVLSLEILA